MGQSQEPEPETPHKRIQRKICEQYNYYTDYYTDASRAAKKTIRDHCNRYYEKYGRWKYVKKTISVIMVIGVGIYTLVTFCLYKIAQQQLMISRDTEIMQLRAYIGISNIDFGQTVNSENKKFFDWFIIPTIENGGNTPALRMIYIGGSAIVHGEGGAPALEFLIPGVIYPDASADPEDQIVEMVKLGKPLAEMVLNPHFKINVGVGAVLLNDVQSGESHTYISGVARYDDVFPLTAHHITKWCFRIGSQFSEKGEFRPAAFPCTHWNCADDGCTDDRRAYYRELRNHFQSSWKETAAAIGGNLARIWRPSLKIGRLHERPAHGKSY